MKRGLCIILAVGVLSVSVVLFLFFGNRVELDVVENAEVMFAYENIEVCEQVSEQELLMIQSVFDGKKYFRDNPSCGFSEKISLKINDEYTFGFARDACPILYWYERDVYIRLTEEEQEKLYDLVRKYGGFFPCI